MQPQAPKSIGGALVDVFDAALSLVKTEVRQLSRTVGNIIKAKGLGVVLLLASLVPLTLALIFLILFVFYGLMRLGLGAWAAALIIAVVALAAAGLLVLLGFRRLTAEVPEASADTGASGAQRNVDRAEKNLDKAERNLDRQTERGEKQVDKAERNLERAEDRLDRAQGASSTGTASGTASGSATSAPTTSARTSSVTETTYFVADSHSNTPSSSGAHANTARPARGAEDGIPVSTKPQLGDEEDRR